MLQGMVQFANDAILVLDGENRLVDANARFFELYGYTPDELGGLTLTELRSPDGLSNLDTDLRRAAAAGSLTFETEHRRKDGTVFPVEVSTRVLDGGRKVSVVRDISQRREAERQLARTNRMYAAVHGAHQALLHASSAEDLYERICRAATAYGLKMAWVGLADGSTIRPVHWSGEGSAYLADLVITLDESDPRSWGPTSKAARLGLHVICNDFANDPATTPWRDRAAAHGWRSSGAFPLFRGGMPVGALNLYSDEVGFFGPDEVALLDDLAGDISFLLDRMQVEEHKDRLENALQQSLDSLVAANLDLERFSEIYWHDLQEPVRNVVAFSQWLERSLAGRLDDETSQLITMIIGAAKRIAQLNHDLLAFSRTRHGEVALKPTDLGETWRHALAEMEQAIANSRAVVETAPLPVVLGSEAELRQVFMALLSNALKFAAPERAPHIALAAERDGDGWHVTMRDNGIGIDAPYLEKIFGIFVRLHTAAAYPGSGIGLAICRKIVERHGGRIWAESTPGAGTTIHLWLQAITPRRP